MMKRNLIWIVATTVALVSLSFFLTLFDEKPTVQTRHDEYVSFLWRVIEDQRQTIADCQTLNQTVHDEIVLPPIYITAGFQTRHDEIQARHDGTVSRQDMMRSGADKP